MGPLLALPPAYLAALAGARLGGGPHFEHCRLGTALAVTTATLLLGGGACPMLLALAALAACPRR